MAKTEIKTGGIKDLNVTVAKLPAVVDISTKTVTLPATVGGLGTGIDAATQLNNKVPAANLGTGTASATTFLAGDQTYQTILGETKPTVTAISAIIPPSVATSVTITGTNFASDSTHVPIVEAVSSTNAYTRASVVSWASATSISATFDLPLGDYRVRVENPDGNAGMSATAILQSSSAPTWTTAAGSLGSFAALAAISETVVATSDSAITYTSNVGSGGTFPGGVTLAAATGVISGTETGSSATTTYTFDITPTDAESQVGAAREFTITISHGGTGGGQFN